MAKYTEVDQDLAFDRRMFGICFWREVDGVKVRVLPQDVMLIRGSYQDREGNPVSASAVKS